MKKLLTPALLLLFFCFSACDKKESNGIYDECCGVEPTVDTVHFAWQLEDFHGNLVDTNLVASIYIPNIFTPFSSDDWFPNSLFMVFSSEHVKQVVSAKYYCDCGAVLFSKFNFLPNDASFGWTGERADGSIYKGAFRYEVKVEFRNGQQKTYSGRACAYSCGEPGFPKENLPDCFFPSQNNGYGGPDLALPRPLDCFNQ